MRSFFTLRLFLNARIANRPTDPKSVDTSSCTLVQPSIGVTAHSSLRSDIFQALSTVSQGLLPPIRTQDTQPHLPPPHCWRPRTLVNREQDARCLLETSKDLQFPLPTIRRIAVQDLTVANRHTAPANLRLPSSPHFRLHHLRAVGSRVPAALSSESPDREHRTPVTHATTQPFAKSCSV
ncbi:hypothetical protein NMY22_g19601 [Coprinellus aureogranulatus]|nr:hypothetical protein NMY22_g19601 [Coprinellus aureogranulatus]